MRETIGTSHCSEKCTSLRTWSVEECEQFLGKKANLEMEIKELETKLKEEEDDLKALRQHQEQLETKKRLEDDATEKLKCEKKFLRGKIQKLKSEVDMLNNKIEQAKNYELSAMDAARIHSCQLKFNLYKQITGVRWCYNVKSPQGYIVNKKTYYAKPFALQSSNEDKLWEKIAEASSADWSAFPCE